MNDRTWHRDSVALAWSRRPGVGQKALREFILAWPEDRDSPDFEVPSSQSWSAPNPDSAGATREWESLVAVAEADLRAWSEQGIGWTTIRDETYPALLRLIRNAPPVLYYRGDPTLFRQYPAIAVVGTRDPAPISREIARRVSRYFAEHGFTIVSGLAKGIDTEAHKGALEASGRTIAVYGTPLTKTYPAENKQLALQIVDAGGLLVSEIPPGGGGGPHAFVQRDRIQSGLSAGVVAVQTSADGGTMHTARFADEQRREVLCPRLDETITSGPGFSGNRELIQQHRCVQFTRDDYPMLLARLTQLTRSMANELVPEVAERDRPLF